MVKSNSRVPDLRSSANVDIVIAGMKKRKMKGTRSNMDLREALFSKKSVVPKNQPVNSRKTLITT